MPKNWSRILALTTLIVLAAIFRLLPHPPNFSPITAIALFAGVKLDRKILAIVVPLAAMLLSDLFLGFHDLMAPVYGSMILVAFIGFALKDERSPLKIGAATLAGSLLFFFTTNFAVWAQGGFYDHSWAGLTACYIAGLPFLQNAVAGDLFFSAVLFGSWAYAENKLPQLRANA